MLDFCIPIDVSLRLDTAIANFDLLELQLQVMVHGVIVITTRPYAPSHLSCKRQTWISPLVANQNNFPHP